ncbi:MAG: DegT/DnrJ/EryC1/StrS family aminotransferase, partial [Deltaproteobacteria bacterium]|nr:DegT/DnrJ/EryC1/StrS family aminotransferase [Deltaproteobacteria bacterium]
PPLIGEEEIQEVVGTLKSGWLTTGPRTEKFETALKEYVGVQEAVAVNSCTAALHLALKVLEIGPPHGVITTPLTFASTGHVIMYQQARPFFVDVEPGTFNLDPDLIREFLEKECRPDGLEGRPRHLATDLTIKAILPVHYGGHPCRMDEIMALAEKHNLYVVEDAAHALGAGYKGRPIGGIGHITCFSFYATKNLTTGEGGMLVTNDRLLAQRARILSMYGISDARRIWQRYAPKGSWVYDIAELGCKYNMMDIQAAMGLHQLAKLDGFMTRRAENAGIYREILTGLDQIQVLTPQDYARHAWHLFPLLLNPDRLKIDRDTFIERLKELNIGASVLFIPLHYHSYYQQALPYREGDFPVTEGIFRRLLNLPLSPAIPADTIAKVARTIAGLIRENS